MPSGARPAADLRVECGGDALGSAAALPSLREPKVKRGIWGLGVVVVGDPVSSHAAAFEVEVDARIPLAICNGEDPLSLPSPRFIAFL